MTLTESQFMRQGYTGYSSVQKSHAFSEQLVFVLYSSVANILRFLTWIATELFFSRSFSNIDIFSL